MHRRLTYAAVAGVAMITLTGGAAYAVAGNEITDPGYGFLAQIKVSDGSGLPIRGCTGSLIEAQWVVTAAQCFTVGGVPPVSGAPASPATVTVGGTTVAVTTLVPHPDRDVVLAELATPVLTVSPAPIGAPAPATTETLQALGYGRTATEWVPDQPHSALFSVQDVTGSEVGLAGIGDTAAICQGDAGGPLLRAGGNGPELVALSSASWQRGCLGAAGTTRNEARATRLDDLADWIRLSISAPGALTGLSVVRSGLLTADRYADVLGIESSTGKLWLYPGSPTGTVVDRRVEVGRAGWKAFNQLAVGDFTGDGLADIAAVETSTGALWLYPNTGQSGLSQLGTRIQAGRSGWNAFSQLTTGDFTGDNRTDLVAVESAAAAAWVYPVTGPGTVGTRSRLRLIG